MGVGEGGFEGCDSVEEVLWGRRGEGVGELVGG